MAKKKQSERGAGQSTPTPEVNVSNQELPAIYWQRSGTNTKSGKGMTLEVKGHTLPEVYGHFVHLKGLLKL